MRLTTAAFAGATLAPALFLGLAALAGGGWVLVALLYLTVLSYLLDSLIAHALPGAPEGSEFPIAEALSIGLGLAHLVLLPLAVWAVGGPSGLGAWERIGCALAFGLFFGQVSHPNAHELIHRAARFPRWLGVAVYTSLLFGHHASAHPKVHHVHVATPRDPNTPRRGEGFYRFALRAWIGSFREGLRAENAMRARKQGAVGLHPYAVYLGGAAACVIAALGLGGPLALAALLGLAGYAQMQLLLSDYVQHYGLERLTLPDGRPEPVGPRHSWNAPHWFSSALMLNAPRHSDHHTHPSRPFPALRLTDEMPMLPRSLPAMASLALFPSLWRRVMDRRAARWRGPAESCRTAAE